MVRIILPHGLYILAVLVCTVGCAPLTLAQRPNASILSFTNSIPKPTLGGTQFWSDQHFFHDWRIQRRVDSDEYRLLDTKEWQHAYGSYETCLAKLEEIQREQELEPMRGKAVVLLHGLAAPRWSMQLLGRHIHKNAGHTVINVEYASTRCGMDEHARSLANVLKSLDGIEEIDMVGHSMGNIVIRRYLAGDSEASDGWQADPRINRVVMIAPPNHGSLTATRWSDNGLFKTVLGQSAKQLGTQWADLEGRLATPEMEFGIIAGGRSNGGGFAYYLPGGDDGRITIETTLLEGASDFVTVPMMHEFIANDPRVLDYTLHFLQDGYFISPEAQRPIHRDMIAERPSVPAR